MANKKKFHPGGNVPPRRPRRTFRGRPIPTLGGSRRRKLPTRMPAGNPMMPTGGIDRMGRPVQGTTAMPGPEPDAQRMRRMQQLMRRQTSQRRQAQRKMQQQQRRGRMIGLSDSFQSKLQSRPFNPRSQHQRQIQQRFTNARKALQVNRGPRPPRMR